MATKTTSKISISRIRGFTGRSAKTLLGKGAKFLLSQAKEVRSGKGKKENPNHTRPVVNRENLGLIISKPYLIKKSAAFELLNNSNPALFNKIYSSIITEIDAKFKTPFPTDSSNLSGSKIYNYKGNNERIVISFSSEDSKDNFNRLQKGFSDIVKKVEEQYRPQIDSNIEDLLVLNSFNRVFKGNITRAKGKTKVGAKDFAVKLVNRYAKVDNNAATLKEAGISLPFTKNQLKSSYFNSASNITGYTKYDIIFSMFGERFEQSGLLQDRRVGLEVGHIGGIGGRVGPETGPTSSSDLKLVSMELLAAESAELQTNAALQNELNKARTEFDKEKIELEILRDFSASHQTISLILGMPESNESNRLDAKAKQDLLDSVAAKFGDELPKISGSPSLLYYIESSIIAAITGKPTKSVRAGLKDNFKLFEKGKAKSLKRTVKLKKYRTKAQPLAPLKKYRPTGSLLGLHGLINQILTEQVKQQMADSAATDGRLRYQTGRFAESANLLTLTSTQAGYKRDPYDVFLPGGRLGTPKRDPRIYVEGAIRNAAISILKGKFKGILLELQ